MSKILIVEDYVNIQQVYQTALSFEGYDVAVASDGKQALEMVERHEPDLILLDLLMANIGGLEFLKTFDLTKHPHTKVIVISSLSSPELAKEAATLGAHAYLTKSDFTPKELVAVIKQTLAEA